MFYINEYEYPADYSFISEDVQKKIVDYLNSMYESRKKYAKKIMVGGYFNKTAARAFEETAYAENAIIDFLATFGIKVEIDWQGHKDGYFLATYNDALIENMYYDDFAYDAEGDIDEYRIGGDYY